MGEGGGGTVVSETESETGGEAEGRETVAAALVRVWVGRGCVVEGKNRGVLRTVDSVEWQASGVGLNRCWRVGPRARGGEGVAVEERARVGAAEAARGEGIMAC